MFPNVLPKGGGWGGEREGFFFFEQFPNTLKYKSLTRDVCKSISQDFKEVI